MGATEPALLFFVFDDEQFSACFVVKGKSRIFRLCGVDNVNMVPLLGFASRSQHLATSKMSPNRVRIRNGVEKSKVETRRQKF